MSANEGVGGSPTSAAQRDSDASLDKLLWSDCTEEEYLKQMVGSNDIDSIVNEDDQATTSTLPGAIKVMDDIKVDENASLENRYISSSLERILRFVNRNDARGSAQNSSRIQTDLVGNHDDDDNYTVDDMIEESEREEETNLNSILERIPTNHIQTNPWAASISSKKQGINTSQSVQEQEVGSHANVSKKKSLLNTMNNSFSPNARGDIEDGNDSLAGNETIDRIVTHMMDGGISTMGSQEERTLRSWTDFQPIAGSVATPRGKNSINDRNDFSKNRFVHDDTSVGSISEEIEVIVAEHKRKLEDEVGAIKIMTEGDGGTLKDTMVSSLSFDATYRARTMLAMGAMPSTEENSVRTPPTSKIEGKDDDKDVEEGKSESWWLKAEKLQITPVKSFETPSPQNSVGKSKEAPDTPSTVVIFGMASPSSSEEDGDEFQDDRYSLKSMVLKNNKPFPHRICLAYLKRLSDKYGSWYLWVIVGSVSLLVLSMILIIAATAKISNSAGKSNDPPPSSPPPAPSTEAKDVFDLEPTTINEPPFDAVSSLDLNNEDSFQIDGSTELSTSSPKQEETQSDPPAVLSYPIEDINNAIDQGITEESWDSMKPNVNNVQESAPNPIEDTADAMDLGPTEESLPDGAPNPMQDNAATIALGQVEDSGYSKWPHLQDATFWNADSPDFAFVYERLIKTLAERLPESLSLLGDPSSPQFRAMQWLSANPPTIEELKFRPLAQKYVLAVLYYTTNGHEWDKNTGWMSSDDECDWYATSSSGSLCDSAGRAFEIDLRRNNLVGTLPPELVLLADHVTRIRVNGNSLGGTIPSFLEELKELERFHIHWNSFTGTLPDNLGELSSKLLSLRLGKNHFSGTIPWQLRNLELLEALDIEANKLTGTLPFFLGDLTALKELNLQNNQLSGTIPLEFMKLELLTELELDRNNLTGSMPTEICSRLPFLEVATVDCEEVYCWCCEGCDGIHPSTTIP